MKKQKKNGSHWAQTYVADPAVSLAKGIIGAGESAMGLANLATNGEVGRVLDDTARYWSGAVGLPRLGYDPGAAKRYLNTLYTPEQQAYVAAVDEAQGIDGKLDAMRQHPARALAHAGIEATPVVLSAIAGGGGLAGRGAQLAGKVAPFAPRIAGALGGEMGQGVMRLAGASATEGVYGAGQEADRITREGGAVWDNMGEVAARGATDAAIGLVGHAVGPLRRMYGNVRAGLPVGRGVGTMIGNDLRSGANSYTTGALVKGMGSEGGLENVLQTGVDVLSQAPLRPDEMVGGGYGYPAGRKDNKKKTPIMP